MRLFLLASTAVLMTAGVALAQSSTTASPAPTGAVSAPSGAPANASPGNLAPKASGGTSTGMSMSSMSGPAGGTTTSSPAPNGAVSAPDVTASSATASPGKTAPNNAAPMATASSSPATPATTGGSQTASNTPSRPMHHHMMMHSMTLPQDASATTYLHIAKTAIWHHNVSLADDALSHAETRLLDRAVPQGQIAADDSAPIQSIEGARKALQSGDYSTASQDTKQAASTVSGM